MTTTDEARVTDEEIAREIESWLRVAPTSKTTRVLSELADRLAARERERDEAVALLEARQDNCCHPGVMFGECHFGPGRLCWEHRRRALLARLKEGVTP